MTDQLCTYRRGHGSMQMMAVMALILFSSFAGADDSLAKRFQSPPQESGIRAFWWWLNGNVTKASITHELEEMKDKGFSGAMIFDADGSNQRGNQRVPAGPTFGSPAWTDLFVHACKEADRLGLELSLNIQSGWNLGGPKVTAAEATQTLVWSKTEVTGGAPVAQELPQPKAREFYRDVAVIAVPAPTVASVAGRKLSFEIEASSTQGGRDASLAMDAKQDTFWVSRKGPTRKTPQWLLIKLSDAVEIGEVALRGRSQYGPRECEIQVSLDAQTFQTVRRITIPNGEKVTATFPIQPAAFVRLLFTDAYDTAPVDGIPRNVQVSEIELPQLELPASPSHQPIKHLLLKSSTRELGMSAPDCRFLLDTEPAIPGEHVVPFDGIVNLTEQTDADGTLRWDAPQGRWMVLRIGHTNVNSHVSTHSAGWGGRVLDYMNPGSLDAYWNRNITPLMNAIGPLAGTTLKYVHTDSWEGGGMNWTPGFDETFQLNRGYDPIPWLAVLAGYVVESREDSNAFLADFRKTIGDRITDHYGHLAAIADRYGMGTHPECSGPHAGPLDGLKNYGRSELMMSEFWSPSPHRPNPPDRFFVKQAASAAHTYGKRLVGAEGFTTIGPHWNDVPWSSMKPSFDHEYCAGLNLLFNHTFTASPKEMGIPGQEYFAGTHFNPQITWWNESTALIDYFRRCQYIAQQGQFVADVLYYYGDHIPNIATLKEADPAGALPNFGYDVLSEELLLDGLTFQKGLFELPSGMEYRVLVLPDHKILSLGVLQKINSLVRRGGTVLGSKPTHAVSLEGGAEGRKRFQQLADGLWGSSDKPVEETGLRSVGNGHVAWGMSARELLHSMKVPSDVHIEGINQTEDIQWIHYRLDDDDVYFLCETKGQPTSLKASFRVTGRLPELWDAVDGSIRQAQTFSVNDHSTEVPLELDPFGSLFVVFRQSSHRQSSEQNSRNDGPNFPSWTVKETIQGPWQVKFDSRWGGPDEPVRFETLSDWTQSEVPGIKHYSGKAVYKTTFSIDDDQRDQPISLQLGDVKDVGIARVSLNGKDLGVVWRPPFRVNVTDALKQGKNSLTVTVVNSWRNRLIGDRDLPENKRLTRTNITVTNQWALEPSGLLGPVEICVDDSN
ncbi:glycosyl hydrolase [Rhodopirellula sallentina]|nr:glycosyl hydrolase [Rhodopirellula sallentina]